MAAPTWLQKPIADQGPTDATFVVDAPRTDPAMLANRPIVVPWTQRSLYVEVTSRCNSLCIHCPRTFHGRDWDDDVSLAQFLEILDQLPGLKRIVLHGLGEPLLNRELPDMIGELKRRGIHVVFNSNAISLTPRHQERLIHSGLDELRVSFDSATAETYAQIRGVPAFERVSRNVAGLLALKRRRGADLPAVSAWFVTMRENLHELPAFVRHVAALGVRDAHIQRLVYFGEGLAVEEQSIFGQLAASEERLLAEAETIAQELGVRLSASGGAPPRASFGSDQALVDHPWWTCRRPWEQSYVAATGEVLACCFVPFVTNAQWHDHVLGNIHRQSLAEIWNGERYQQFRREFLSDRPPATCAGCGSKWSV